MTTQSKIANASRKFVRSYYQYGTSTKRADQARISAAARSLARTIGFDFKKYEEPTTKLAAKKRSNSSRYNS